MAFQSTGFQTNAFQITGGGGIVFIQSWQFTIGGIDRTDKVRINSVDITYTQGSRGFMRFETLDTQTDTATAYRPTPGMLVGAIFNGDVKFAGTIVSVRDRALGEPNTGVVTSVTAEDRSGVTDRRRINVTFAAGSSPKQICEYLAVNWLNVYGVVLDPTMFTWGALAAAETFDYATPTEILNRVFELFGTPWRITPDNVLEMFSIGTKLTPYLLSWQGIPAPPFVLKDIHGGVEWTLTLSRKVNRQFVRAGQRGKVIQVTDTFVTTAPTTAFDLRYPAWKKTDDPVLPYPYYFRSGFILDGSFQSILPYGFGHPNHFQYNPTANGGKGSIWVVNRPPVAAGSTAVITYDAQLPVVVSAEDTADITANGPYEAIDDAPTIDDYDGAVAHAQTLLNRYKVLSRELTVSTYAEGRPLPGDLLPVHANERLATGNWLITEVQFKPAMTYSAAGMYTRMKCLEANSAGQVRTWVDYFRSRLGSGAS